MICYNVLVMLTQGSSRGPENITIDNAAYMVTANTFKRRPLFSDPANAGIIATHIMRGAALLHYWLFAYVVMPDHFHVVILPRRKTLSESMRILKGASSRELNTRRKDKPGIWQSGFMSRPIVDEGLLLAEVGYVESNPVRKGLVEQQEEHPFSSATVLHPWEQL